MIIDTDKIRERLEQAEKEGKVLPRMARRSLAERTDGRGIRGNSKAAAALYILGATLTQIANSMGIKRETALSYVRSQAPQALRELARNAKKGRGRKNPILQHNTVNEYYERFLLKNSALWTLEVTQIATRMREE